MRTIESIKEKYPKMFTDTCFGFHIGDGWLGLVDDLCGHIQFHIDNHGVWNKKLEKTEPLPQVEVHQIKEKFGGLRFYVGRCDDYTRGMISFAESVSYKLCEHCGSTKEIGKMRGWIKIRCRTCAQERLKDWTPLEEDKVWSL